MSNDSTELPKKPGHLQQPDVAQRIAWALEGLQFGSVRIVVHDGMVLQIERTERVRLR